MQVDEEIAVTGTPGLQLDKVLHNIDTKAKSIKQTINQSINQSIRKLEGTHRVQSTNPRRIAVVSQVSK